MSKPEQPKDTAPRQRQREDASIEGMGGGIAGPSEPGAAGTAAGGTAVGGELATGAQPSRKRDQQR
jgi:hypothetical protein